MMRVAGLFSRDQTALRRFADQWQHAATNGGPASLQVSLYPVREPLLAIVRAENCHPPLQWAESPDGSLSLLDGEVFDTNGAVRQEAPPRDAAAMLSLYASKGPEAISAMNGGAALVILDANRRALLIFRDRYGQVPVFYADRPEGLYWASDLPSLLRQGIPAELDRLALDAFLARGYVPAPWTFVKEIRKIPAAHYICCSESGRVEAKAYWTATARPKIPLSPRDMSERLGELIEQAIRRRVANGGRVAALLSGGVDSALLVGCLAARTKADVEAFTFRYGAYEGRHNEYSVAHETAQHFDIAHHPLHCDPADVAAKFDQMVGDYGEPFMWGIHTFNLQPVARMGIRTLLTGAGVGDWSLKPIEDKVMLLRRLPAPLLDAIAAPIPLVELAHRNFARRATTFLRWCRAPIPLSAITPVMSDAYRRRVYSDPALADVGQHAVDELLGDMRQGMVDESERDQFVFLRQRLFIAECNLFWNHAWARASGLAARHPYYDNDLQEFVMRVERKASDKRDLRRYAATILPRDKAYAPKIYHTIPLESWFRGPLHGFLRDQLSPDRLNRQGLFNPAAVTELIDEHVRGVGRHTWRLLGVLAVTAWHDAVLKGSGSGHR